MIWRRVSKSWREWLKYFTVCVANDLKYWMAETYFDRRKSKTRVFWLLFCSQKSDRKYFMFIFYSWVIIVFKWIHMPFGEVLTQKHLKLRGGATVWLRYSFSLMSLFTWLKSNQKVKAVNLSTKNVLIPLKILKTLRAKTFLTLHLTIFLTWEF